MEIIRGERKATFKKVEKLEFFQKNRKQASTDSAYIEHT
jgi:hypothetical protein